MEKQFNQNAINSVKGPVREINQDSAYYGKHLFLVADGMGGHRGGEIASTIAIKEISLLDIRLQNEEFDDINDALRALEHQFSVAHNRILDFGNRWVELNQMGTTIVALLVYKSKVAVAHLGDSRIYQFSNGILTQITNDHSMVQELVNAGRITPEEALNHPKRNMVTKVLGYWDIDISPDIALSPAIAGERYLLCSDGLTSVLSNKTLAKILKSTKNPKKCADRLISMALSKKSQDNISIIIVDIDSNGRAVISDECFMAGAVCETDLDNIVIKPVVPENESVFPVLYPNDKGKSNKIKAIQNTAQQTYSPIRIKFFAILAIAILVAGLSFAGGKSWVFSHYYVGNHQGNVTIFNGIPLSIGPFHFFEIYQKSSLALSNLETSVQDQIKDNIVFDRFNDAEQLVLKLTNEVIAKRIKKGNFSPPEVTPKK